MRRSASSRGRRTGSRLEGHSRQQSLAVSRPRAPHAARTGRRSASRSRRGSSRARRLGAAARLPLRPVEDLARMSMRLARKPRGYPGFCAGGTFRPCVSVLSENSRSLRRFNRKSHWGAPQALILILPAGQVRTSFSVGSLRCRQHLSYRLQGLSVDLPWGRRYCCRDAPARRGAAASDGHRAELLALLS